MFSLFYRVLSAGFHKSNIPKYHLDGKEISRGTLWGRGLLFYYKEARKSGRLE